MYRLTNCVSVAVLAANTCHTLSKTEEKQANNTAENIYISTDTVNITP